MEQHGNGCSPADVTPEGYRLRDPAEPCPRVARRQPLSTALSVLMIALALLFYEWYPVAGKKW